MNRHRRFVTATALVVAPLLLVGCTPAPATTTEPITTGSTTAATPFQIMCTPVVGNTTPTPCTQAEYDKLRQQRQDYAAAEKVYRAFFDEDVKLLKSGELATPEVRLLLAGPMIDQYEMDKKRQHDAGVTGVGEVKLAYVRPSAATLKDGSQIALDVCKDGSGVAAYRDGVPAGNASIVRGHAFLTRVDGVFKIWSLDGEVVGSC